MSNINVNNITPVSGDTISISGSLFISGTFAGALNNTLQLNSSQNYLSGSTTQPLGLGVTGSILPGDNGIYDLGSPNTVWRHLFLSSASLKFVSESGEITGVSQDDAKQVFEGRKASAGMAMKRVRGFTSASTFIDLEATNKTSGDRIDIKVADTFEALSISTDRTSLGPKETVPLELTGSLNIRPANNTQHQFHGKYQFSGQHAAGSSPLTSSNSTVAMEISGSSILSGSNADGTPAASFEIDANSGGNETAGFQIMMQGGDPISSSTNLLSYYDISNSMFDTSSAASSFLAYGALGVQMANNPNVIIENGVVSTNGIISASMVIGRIGQPANAMFENGEVTISQGTIIRVLLGSKFIIQDQQPDITADSDTGTVTISDPTVEGGGDVVINPDNGGNPSIIHQNTTIPTNQVSYWTVGNNLPGTYTQTNSQLQSNSVGIQIGANISVLYDGIFINGEEIVPSLLSSNEALNIKLRIEDGAVLYIQPASVITTNDDGDTEVGGDVIVDGNVAEGFSNDAQVTSSLTLSVATHGLGKQVFVRSGSNPLIGIEVQTYISSSHPYYGLPVPNIANMIDASGGMGSGMYINNPAGTINLELPSASVGMSFDIRSAQLNSYNFIDGYTPTINVTPNGSERFIIKADGSSGDNGKGVLLHSSSYQSNARIHVTCQSGSDWTIINLNGAWQDEA